MSLRNFRLHKLKKQLISAEFLAPLTVGVLFLIGWDVLVKVTNMPPYILPDPLLVIKTLINDWNELFPALIVTLNVTIVAFIIATLSGLFIAILFAQSKWIEKSFFPYAVILQTTPIASIAPLIIIWFKNNTFAAIVVCAWIIALFPIISNTTVGLNSVDRNLSDLFRIYKASRWQTLLYLRLPSAMPYFLAGLKISGGLSLIGAVVAEFVAGTGGRNAGIAYQILMAGYNLQIPRMFAALLMVSSLGIIIFILLSAFSDFILRNWHESARNPEN